MTYTHQDAKARFWGLTPPDGIKHGPNTHAARAYGCDCKVCLPSGRRKWTSIEGATGPKSPKQRRDESRKRLHGTPVPEGTKHGIYAYHVYGCRCATCVAAKRAGDARRHWTNKARGRYSEGKDAAGQPTTIRCWPPRDAGPDWQCPDPSHQEV